MTVVVTGASGFIGTQVTQALLARGERVVGLDRVPPTVAGDGFETLHVDLAAPHAEAFDALRAADAVVHLAARPGVRDCSPRIELRRHMDNVVATAQVLAAVPLPVPVVVASSSSVYGGSRRGRPSREDDRLRPRGGYARSKVAAEQRCAARAAAGGAVTVVRPFTVVGDGQRADMALARWIVDARAGRPLVVYGGLARRRDLTDVRDVVRAVLALLDRGARTTVNVGSGVGHSLAEIAAAVGDVVAPVTVEVVPLPVSEPDETLADTRRGAATFGFVPTTDVLDVVRRAASSAGDAEHLRLVS
ncbi:MAG TPA: NAD(P)-dependent oxidoreductase [Acidimicrobiales bacterium]|nr:NAD(P)-dependent oxidoreductase [Acidimicrobiales bacterium]